MFGSSAKKGPKQQTPWPKGLLFANSASGQGKVMSGVGSFALGAAMAQVYCTQLFSSHLKGNSWRLMYFYISVLRSQKTVVVMGRTRVPLDRSIDRILVVPPPIGCSDNGGFPGRGNPSRLLRRRRFKRPRAGRSPALPAEERKAPEVRALPSWRAKPRRFCLSTSSCISCPLSPRP